MADALTLPFIVAALVLCVAGVAKVRSPATAERALMGLGLPSLGVLVRPAAVIELTLGIWAIVSPSAAVAAALAAVYAVFAAISYVLAARRAGCGCFGESDVPATRAQSLLSAAFAAVAAGGAIGPVHGLAWVLSRSPLQAGVLITGAAGAAYGLVLAYTRVSAAWSAWSGSAS